MTEHHWDPLRTRAILGPRGPLARYVHARRRGYRILRRLLPNVIGPFYSHD